MSDQIGKDRIKAIFLANGFKEKPQADGSTDLNPYVYDAAKALADAVMHGTGAMLVSAEGVEHVPHSAFFKKYDRAVNDTDALRDALSAIVEKVQESRSETRRLNWIEGRATAALEGKPWVKVVFQMPDPKNGAPKAERLSRELAALREELAAAKVRENLLLNNPRNVFKQMCDLALKQRDEARQRLTDAERRNAELEGLLVRCHNSDNLSQNCGLWKDLDATLKSTESGASE